MKKLTNLILISLLSLSIGLHAQLPSPEMELERIQQAQKALTSFSQEVVCQVFAGWDSEEVLEEEKVKLIRKEQEIYMKLSHMEYLASYALSLDHDARVALLANRPDDLPSDRFELDLEALVASCDAIDMEVDKGLRTCKLSFLEGEYALAEISYDPSTYLLSAVTLYFREESDFPGLDTPIQPKMEIAYTAAQAIDPQAEARISLANYLRGVPRKPTLKGNWAQYQLISYL